MHRDDVTRLDIIRAMRFVVEFKRNMDKAAYLNDFKTQSAVFHQLMVMGEAVKRLSEAFCKAHPEIPWSLIAQMRDKLIHGYDIVDLDEVWKTANMDVPQLILQLERLLPRQDNEKVE